jgi:ATP-binding protein involved in chromosome partitioning
MRVAGVIENMSHLVCSCCGEITRPFGEGGGRKLADDLRVPLLGQVPLDEPLRIASDGGTPLVISDPQSASAAAMLEIARAVPGVLRPRSGAERIKKPLAVL